MQKRRRELVRELFAISTETLDKMSARAVDGQSHILAPAQYGTIAQELQALARELAGLVTAIGILLENDGKSRRRRSHARD